jgi:hypothetical protein
MTISHLRICSLIATTALLVAGCAPQADEAATSTESVIVVDQSPIIPGLTLLNSRALINRNGTTDVTTNVAGTESIESIDLSLYSNLGDLVSELRILANPAGPALASNVAGLTRGQPYSIRGHVVGSDGQPLTGLASGAGALRPDIAVTGDGGNDVGGIIAPERGRGIGWGGIIAPERPGNWGGNKPGGIIAPERGIIAPERARVGRPVQIGARLAELNEDVGATTDCTLIVDGVVVQAQTNVAVPAGQTTRCSFSHNFGSPGRYHVVLQARNVTPGDWDESNNSAEDWVTIIAPERN